MELNLPLLGSAVCFLVNLERETAVCCLEVGDDILNISISSKKESPSRMMSPPWLRGSCPTRGEYIAVEAERSGSPTSACTGREGVWIGVREGGAVVW